MIRRGRVALGPPGAAMDSEKPGFTRQSRAPQDEERGGCGPGTECVAVREGQGPTSARVSQSTVTAWPRPPRHACNQHPPWKDPLQLPREPGENQVFARTIKTRSQPRRAWASASAVNGHTWPLSLCPRAELDRVSPPHKHSQLRTTRGVDRSSHMRTGSSRSLQTPCIVKHVDVTCSHFPDGAAPRLGGDSGWSRADGER